MTCSPSPWLTLAMSVLAAGTILLIGYLMIGR